MRHEQEVVHHFQDAAGKPLEPSPGYQYMVIHTIIRVESRMIGGPLIHLTHVLGEWP